jgi:hypothetical protein
VGPDTGSAPAGPYLFVRRTRAERVEAFRLRRSAAELDLALIGREWIAGEAGPDALEEALLAWMHARDDHDDEVTGRVRLP